MVDRNLVAKQQFAAAQARQAFIRALASGETGAYDKEKNRLEEGQLLIWNPTADILYWLVKDVGPALDLPQPAVRVTLTIEVPIILQPGVRMGNMLVVGKQEEQDPAALARDTIAGEERPSTVPQKESEGAPPEEPTDGDAPKPPDD